MCVYAHTKCLSKKPVGDDSGDDSMIVDDTCSNERIMDLDLTLEMTWRDLVLPKTLSFCCTV